METADLTYQDLRTSPMELQSKTIYKCTFQLKIPLAATLSLIFGTTNQEKGTGRARKLFSRNNVKCRTNGRSKIKLRKDLKWDVAGKMAAKRIWDYVIIQCNVHYTQCKIAELFLKRRSLDLQLSCIKRLLWINQVFKALNNKYR